MNRRFERVILKFLVNYIIKKNADTEFFYNVCAKFNNNPNAKYKYRIIPTDPSLFYKRTITTDTKDKELAIVIQGIVDTHEDFTLNTVKVYKKIFPGSIIVISTWDYTDKDVLNSLEKEGCYIVISKDFKPSGYANVNYQLKTSLEGVKVAKDLGAKYCIKNRSDLRVCKYFTFEYLKSLMEIFPIKDEQIPLKGRIFSLSGHRGQLFLPFWIQDFFYFGYTEDLEKLFDIPNDDRNIKNWQEFFSDVKNIDGLDICNSLPPEIYITKKFIEKYVPINGSIEEYWFFIKNYFFSLDYDELDVISHKKQNFSSQIAMREFNGVEIVKDEEVVLDRINSINIIQGRYCYSKEYEDWSKKIKIR